MSSYSDTQIKSELPYLFPCTIEDSISSTSHRAMSCSSDQTLKSELSISSEYNHLYYAPSTPTTSPTSPHVNTISPELLFSDSSYSLEPFSSSFQFLNSASPSPQHDGHGHGAFSFSFQDTKDSFNDYTHFYPQPMMSKPLSFPFEPSQVELLTANYDSKMSIEHYRPSSSGSIYDDDSSYESCGSQSRRGSSQHSSVLDKLPHIVSSDEKIHVCHELTKEGKECERKFKRQEHLKRHLATHTPEVRPHYCPIPGCKKFSRRDNMKQHYRTHFKKTGRNGYKENLPENPDDYDPDLYA